MIKLTDADTFAKIMHELASVLGLPKGCTNIDDLTQPYWNALVDQPIEVVKQQAMRAQRFGKYFPKPSDLRPKDSKPVSYETDIDRARRQHFEVENRSTWNKLLVKEPLETRWKMLMAYHARTHSGAFDVDSTQYADRVALASVTLAKLLLEPAPGWWRWETLRDEIRAATPASAEMPF